MGGARQRQLEEMRQEKRDFAALDARVRAREASAAHGSGSNDRGFLDFIALLGGK